MTQPALSVAMSIYNGESHLALAIESILSQTFTDFEFLILNDGSTDGSADIVNSYAARDHRIRGIHRENKGLVISLNQLVEMSQAPIVARMDADDIAMPERFERQMAFLAANPDYGVVSSWTIDIDVNGDPFPIKGADQPTNFEDFLKAISGGPLLCHPSAMFRRDLVLSVGGYHGAFRHCEDYDLWLRLSSVTKLCSLPERLMQYRHWSNQVSSRHAFVQQLGAAISYFAYLERCAGRVDPTADLNDLPPVDELDALFGRDGIAKAVRARVAPLLLYSEVALKGPGYDLVMDFVREGGKTDGLWRTVARLMRIGEPGRAASLGLALAQL